MKKFLKSLLIILLVSILGISAYIYHNASNLYKDLTTVLPIEKAVNKYVKPSLLDFEDIDKDFVNAVISVEDKRFFQRKGYDYIALFRAIYNNIVYREFVEGGSTISEQIAKNLYFEHYPRGLDEKLCEILIMHDLEDKYSKEELFALYANMNYYGDGYWGLKRAAWGYYGKKANDLSLAQAAMLAGIPNAPGAYQLSSGYDLAKNRQEKVLLTMVNNGYISEEEKANALLEDVKPIQK